MVIASAVLYVFVLLVLRRWGARLTSSPSTLTWPLLVLIGGVSARATLGDSPTLLGGLVALATLFVLERTLGLASRRWRPRPGRSSPPVVLLIDGEIAGPALTRAGLTAEKLWSRLRQQGVRRRRDAGVVILEPRGTLTVFAPGTVVDAELLADVAGAERIPAAYRSDGPAQTIS